MSDDGKTGPCPRCHGKRKKLPTHSYCLVCKRAAALEYYWHHRDRVLKKQREARR